MFQGPPCVPGFSPCFRVPLCFRTLPIFQRPSCVSPWLMWKVHEGGTGGRCYSHQAAMSPRAGPGKTLFNWRYAPLKIGGQGSGVGAAA